VRRACRSRGELVARREWDRRDHKATRAQERRREARAVSEESRKRRANEQSNESETINAASPAEGVSTKTFALQMTWTATTRL
jgi:hypothetical protein